MSSTKKSAEQKWVTYNMMDMKLVKFSFLGLVHAHLCSKYHCLPRERSEINRQEWGLNICLEQLATDQPDPWQTITREVFYSLC